MQAEIHFSHSHTAPYSPRRFAVAEAARIVYSGPIGAAATAAIQPMINAMGNGASYTIFAALLLISSAGPLMAMRDGMAWRKNQRHKDAKRGRASI